MWNSNLARINSFKRYPVLVENFTQICLRTKTYVKAEKLQSLIS